MARVIGRLFLVPIAVLIATMVAGFVLVSLGQERVVQAIARSGDQVSVDGVFGIGEVALRLAVVVFSVQTMVPVLLLIVAGEVGRIRSPIYYVLGGGIALAIIPLLARVGNAEVGTDAVTALWQLFATAGFAGGFVYWLIAGRTA